MSLFNDFLSKLAIITSFMVEHIGFFGSLLLFGLLPIYLYLIYRYFMGKNSYNTIILIFAVFLSIVINDFIFGNAVISKAGI